MCCAVLIHPKKRINSGTPCVSELRLTWINAALCNLQWITSPVQMLFYMEETCRAPEYKGYRPQNMDSVFHYNFPLQRSRSTFYREIYSSINFYFFFPCKKWSYECLQRGSKFEGGSISKRPVHGICRLITEL